MTTQEKFDLIPAHYLPKFINDDKKFIIFQMPHYVGINLEKATVTISSNTVIIRIDNTSLQLSTTMNDVTINIL
jgi:hypothetical protein